VKKTVIWAGNSQAQLAAVDRENAMRILHAIDDFQPMARATSRSFARPAAICAFA
jgi:hypothetical protein